MSMFQGGKKEKNAKELKERGEGNGSDVNFDICVV